MIPCTQCREHLVAKAQGLLDETLLTLTDQHLNACPECQAEYEQIVSLQSRMQRDASSLNQPGLAEAVAARLRQDQTPAGTRHWVIQHCLRWGMGLSAAAALILVALWFSVGSTTASAAEILAEALKAASDLHSVHIQATMRTAPQDNFELIVLQAEMVPLEMWKRFGNGAAWRVEKSGRVAVMSQDAATLWIKPGNALKAPSGMGFVGWVGTLMDVDKVLENEISLAKKQGSMLSSRQATAADGKQELEVTVEAKAQGSFDQSEWLRNKTITESDNRRVYHFDPQTKRLMGLEVYVHTRPADTLVFAITRMEYNPDLKDEVFTLALPKDVNWMELPDGPAPEKFANMGPEQIARAFFESLSEQRWDDAHALIPVSLDDPTKKLVAGLQVISIGKPMKSGLYPGVFVPYEIRFSTGETKKFNLALRNDNPHHRWYVDGGF
jgi:outer membrane lipoprotein-sorting protein